MSAELDFYIKWQLIQSVTSSNPKGICGGSVRCISLRCDFISPSVFPHDHITILPIHLELATNCIGIKFAVHIDDSTPSLLPWFSVSAKLLTSLQNIGMQSLTDFATLKAALGWWQNKKEMLLWFTLANTDSNNCLDCGLETKWR